jgi:hypothetical protein
MTAVDDDRQLSEDELAAQKTRLDALRAQYRTLPRWTPGSGLSPRESNHRPSNPGEDT